MIKNIVFDFGGVVLTWDPHLVYDEYFGSREKADWFLENICTFEWNVKQDAGRTVEEGYRELIAVHPEWEKEIRMYYADIMKTIGGPIPGMYEYIKELKDRGFGIWGLTNWCRETFAVVRPVFPVFRLMDGIVVSGEEYMLKPDPAFYRLLLERYSLNAEECVFVDDRKANAEAAVSVGMKGIQFLSTEQFISELEPLLKQH